MKRRWSLVLVLWAMALVLRLAFVARLPDLPLYWDEVHYDGHARQYAEAWASIADPQRFAERFRSAFEKSAQKGEAYSAAVGLVYAIADPSTRIVFVLQAVVDALTCLFIYGIARRLGGETVALIALGLASVYEPFIFAAARLQTETLCSFLCIGGLWAFLFPVHTRQLAAGFALALAMLVRPTLQYLFPLLLVLSVVVHSQVARRRRATLAGALALGFFLIIGPRLVWTNAVLGRPLWSGTLDPASSMYGGVVFENLGWPTDYLAFAYPPRGELLAVMQESGGQTPTTDELRRAFLRTWWHHPLQSSAVALHKVYQVWAHPYNDSYRAFLTTRSGQRVWHQVMLVLASIGLPLALRNWRVGVPVVATILYLWAAYLAVHIEVRYVANALPLMLCCAALAASTLARGLHVRWRSDGRGILWVATAVLGVTGVLWIGSLPRMLAVSDAIVPGDVHVFRELLRLAVMGLMAGLVYQGLSCVLERKRAVGVVTVSLLMACAVFLVGRPQAAVWHAWSCPLSSGGARVRQTFRLPADLRPPRSAEVRIDLEGDCEVDSDLVVRVNGTEARRFPGGPKRADAVGPASFYEQIIAGQGRPQCPWHAWYAIRIPPSLLVPNGTLDVELDVEGSARVPGVVCVFGDYELEGEHVYDGPSPFAPGWKYDTSVYKYIGDGDVRMRRSIDLVGSSDSTFFDGKTWSRADLSPDAGRQSGRYRIFLVLTYGTVRVVL